MEEMNVQVEGQQIAEQTEGQNNEVSNARNFKEIVKALMLSGECKRFVGLRVKNVNDKEMDNYHRISFTLDRNIPGYVPDEYGEYNKGLTSVAFSSTYAIAGLLRESEDTTWLGNQVVEKPQILGLILSGAKIDIVQQTIPAHTDYVNPFTSKIDPEPVQFDNDTIINHIVSIELGKTGQKMADMLAIKLMGF